MDEDEDDDSDSDIIYHVTAKDDHLTYSNNIHLHILFFVDGGAADTIK